MKGTSLRNKRAVVRPHLTEFLDEISEELGSRRELHKQDEQILARLNSIVNHSIVGICFGGIDGMVSEANDEFLRIVGYTRAELESGRLNWKELTGKTLSHLDEQALEQLSATGKVEPFEKEYVHKDGAVVPVLSSISHAGAEIVCFSFDLTQYKQAEEKLNYLAYHDALTALPNQALFKDRLQQALALARRNEQMLAVLLLNLDRFKNINDTLGYSASDQLLKEVAARLTGCVRESDTVARLGGDEFGLLLSDVGRAEDAAKIAESVKESLLAPFTFADQDLFVTASIGISLHPDDGNDPASLLKGAGTALNRVKEQDGNDYQFYTSGRTTKALRQLVLENNLRPALDREEFIVHYQPQVNVETFQIVGMEALVRWQHPGLGLLYPLEFIQLAEDSGLIVALGEWVLQRSCSQSKEWQDAGFEPLRVGVNLSARQFKQPRLVPIIGQVLEKTGLDPRFLELEITEGSVMENPDEARLKLQEIKDMGVRISIDDFGTGYSSLNYLKRFPLDALKVDQSFVRDLTTDADSRAIVTAIITLAHALKLNVIAEGVETQEQLNFLRSLGCDEVQGYLFDKPLSAEEFTSLLIERSGLTQRETYDTNPLPSLKSVLQK